MNLEYRITRSGGHGKCHRGHPLPKGLPVLELVPPGGSKAQMARCCVSCGMDLAHGILEQLASALEDRQAGDAWVPCPGCGIPGQPLDNPVYPFVCPSPRALCAVESFDRHGRTSNPCRTLHKELCPQQYPAEPSAPVPLGAPGENPPGPARRGASCLAYRVLPQLRQALQDAVWALDPASALLERGRSGRTDASAAVEAGRALLAQVAAVEASAEAGLCLDRGQRERIGAMLRDFANDQTGGCILTGEDGESEEDCTTHAHERDDVYSLAAEVDPWHDEDGNPVPT
jgi:hypothetical protein